VIQRCGGRWMHPRPPHGVESSDKTLRPAPGRRRQGSEWSRDM
jgi:hypothetical protein